MQAPTQGLLPDPGLQKKVGEMVKNATEQKHHHEKQTHAIALKFPGATATVGPVKTHARAMEKTIKENFGDPTKLKDIIRSTIVAKDPKQLQDIVTHMKSEKNIHRYKSQNTDLGYKGHLFNYHYPNGVIGEIQANLPHRIYAKEPQVVAQSILGRNIYSQLKKKTEMEGGQGHELYQKHRSSANPKEKLNLSKKSKEYYKEIERRALAK